MDRDEEDLRRVLRDAASGSDAPPPDLGHLLRRRRDLGVVVVLLFLLTCVLALLVL